MDSPPAPGLATADRARAIRTVALVVGAWVALYIGWRTFWFLCDDAFIAFRYVNNAHLGHGYVWNPPPFMPVDGYTSFAWVALLDAVWRTAGVEPPDAANWLSLACSAGTVVIVIAMVRRLWLPTRLEPWRDGFVVVVLAGTLSNRTFLAFTSSGLEAALVNLTIIAWVYLCVFVDPERRWWASAVSLAAAAITLTRPDGLVFVGATLATLAWRAARAKARDRRVGLEGTAVLVLTLGPFFGWKLVRYGAWLPNTYYAKVLGAWPAAGLRYLGSFVLEYAVWLWLIPVAVALWRDVHERHGLRPRVLLACAALAGHAGYYTFIVGGDHFEFRVFSHLVPLLLVALVWGIARLPLRRARALGLTIALVAASWPVPWIHWWHTRTLEDRKTTFQLQHQVAPHLPPGLRWYGRWFDDMQAYLIDRFVCMRHQEHKAFLLFKLDEMPSRKLGSELGPEDYPLIVAGEVGVISWVLPHVVIIDGFGLNDRFIARNTEAPRNQRTMGHERWAPPGYVRALRPNVRIKDGKVWIVPRDRPLTASDIERIERRYTVWSRHLE